MKIEVKFNVGDTFVWKDNREAKNRKVKKIIINDKGIFYETFTPHGNYYIQHEENVCFFTREECNLAIIEEIAGETRKE